MEPAPEPDKDRRWYENTTITEDAIIADFRVPDHITMLGSLDSAKASFAIRDRSRC